MPFMILESDLMMFGGLVLVLVVGTALGVRYWWNIRQNAPEAELFLKARKYLHPPPIMRIADTDGNGFLALGKVDQKGDVTFKFSEAGGVQVNPRMQGVTPEDKINGIPFYNYSTQFPFPLSARNAQAFRAIISYTRKNFPQVKFITDLRLLELTALPADQLEHDCTNVIESMEQTVTADTINDELPTPSITLTQRLKGTLGLSDEEHRLAEEEAKRLDAERKHITAPELVDVIKKIQAESHVIPVNKGYFSYDWAFARIPSSILAQDIHQMKLLMKRQLSFENLDQFKMYIPIAFAVLIIVLAAVLLFTLKPATGH